MKYTLKVIDDNLGEYLYDLRESKKFSTKSIEHNKNTYKATIVKLQHCKKKKLLPKQNHIFLEMLFKEKEIRL